MITGRLTTVNYLPIIEKAMARIKDWKFRFLSYAGRLKLIRSVVSSFVRYWSRTVVLPKVVLHRINMLSNKFIWEASVLEGGMH